MDGTTVSILHGGLESRQQRSNPRRTPAHLSKSLPQQEKQKLTHDTDEHRTNVRNDPARCPPIPSLGSGSDESASRWFDKANRNVPHAQHMSPEATADPPFFLSTQQESLPEPVDSFGTENQFGAGHEQDSENQDLRGVIDDLTVENKRLKRLLRSHRVVTNPPPEPKDRLFELRVHGLSAEKKRELENLLRSFTTHTSSSQHSSSHTSAAFASTSGSRKPVSQSLYSNLPVKHTSTLQQTDSGYASISPSRGTSAAISAGGNPSVPVSRSSRNRNIKDYLHDIPDTLLPRQSPVMSERAKQVLVVRRLEQLFTGQKAAPGDHSQPMQQQEVSHSAAQAENGHGMSRRMEGSREAHILPHDAKVSLDLPALQTTSPNKAQNPNSGESGGSENNTSTPSRSGSPDQRPTRPLDLDIHRAQIATENIEYIRHLGLSTPPVQPGNDSKGDSWIYLNLLISMAQLHTLNVTPAFVRKAIKKLSTKFVLSEDGRQVRWRGGSEGSRLPPSEDRHHELISQSLVDATDEQHVTRSDRCRTSNSSNAMLSEELSSEDRTNGPQQSSFSNTKQSDSLMADHQASRIEASGKPRSAFDYRPLVYKGKKYSAAASYLETSSGSSPSGESGELVHQLSKSTLNQRRGSEEGIITFYNNPYFCSDASADKTLIEGKQQSRCMPWQGLGFGRQIYSESPLRYHDACYFTPQFAPKPFDEFSVDGDLSWSLSPISAAGESETQPLELQASGIGGIVPDNNFALDVKVLRQEQEPRPDPDAKVIPLTGSRKRKRYTYTPTSCNTIALQPSKLPPPSYVFFTSSSSSGDPEIESSESDSGSSADEQYPAPAPFLNQWSTGSSDVEFDGEEEDESASVDMLELARAADPEQIAAQEQEYVLTQPNAIAGSLAATVGASRTTSSTGRPGMASDDGLSDMSVDADDGNEDD